MENNLGKLNKKAFRKSSENGATMIEYALMIALIAIVAVVSITNIGKAGNQSFRKIGNHLNTANN
jgi:Flp pilus assembly pilin Flp